MLNVKARPMQHDVTPFVLKPFMYPIYGICCFKLGSMTFRISLLTGNMVNRGETLRISVLLHTDSSIDIESIESQLIEFIDFKPMSRPIPNVVSSVSIDAD